MLKEEQIVGETFAHRFRGEDPKYALIVSHGLGGHGGIYDQFCIHHAQKGVDVWSYDAPGHGRSTPNRPRGEWTLDEWVEAGVALAKHVKDTTGLPVFTLGSSLGVAAAYGALHSADITGGILMGSPAVPSGAAIELVAGPWRNEALDQIIEMSGSALRLDIGLLFNFDEDYGYKGAHEQKKLDPYNTWSYDLASWRSLFTFRAKNPASENTKPILVASGEKDPSFPRETMQMVADSIAGPVEYHCVAEAPHQLMIFETQFFSDLIQTFVSKNL